MAKLLMPYGSSRNLPLVSKVGNVNKITQAKPDADTSARKVIRLKARSR